MEDRATDQLDSFPCTAETDAKSRGQIRVNGPLKNYYTKVRHKQTSHSQLCLLLPLWHILQGKEPQCMAWRGAAAHVSPTGCLGPAVALRAPQHMASPSVRGGGKEQ